MAVFADNGDNCNGKDAAQGDASAEQRSGTRPSTDGAVTCKAEDTGGSRTSTETPTACAELPATHSTPSVASAKVSRKPPVPQFGVALRKLKVITHHDSSILSVDFAPASTSSGRAHRLLSTGQDGSVKIWSLDDGSVSKQKPSPAATSLHRSAPSSVPAQLSCTLLVSLDEHLAPVNCARWSPDCGLIASGDADGALVIWAPGRGHFSTPSRITPGNHRTEPWHRRCYLRGHRGEICDLSWNPGSKARYGLASCAHDGTVLLWNVAQGELSGRIDSPGGGIVKGVAFDPLGQYLATMSDAPGTGRQARAMLWESPGEDTDGTDSVWRQVAVCPSPWEKPAPLGTAAACRRPSWDPLGQSLCFPYGERMKCDVSTPRFFGALFLRGAWQDPKLYRGHTQRVSIVRFSPMVFGPPGDARAASVIFAMGSQDGVVSVWSSSWPAPLVVIQDMLEENCIVTDVAWSPCGRYLALASNDGAVGLVELDLDLGTSNGQPVPRWSPFDVQRWLFEQQLEVSKPTWDLPIGSREADVFLTRKRSEASGMGEIDAPVAKRLRSESTASVLEPKVEPSSDATSPQSAFWSAFRRRGSRRFCTAEQATWETDADAATPSTSSTSDWRPSARPARRRPPAGVWTVANRLAQMELRVEPIASGAAISQEAHTGQPGGVLSRLSVTRQHGPEPLHARRWQLVISGRITCAQVTSEFVAFVVEDSCGEQQELFIADAASGRLAIPPMQLSSAVVDMRLASRVVIVVGENARMSVVQVLGENAPSVIITTAPVPRLGEDYLVDFGLLNNSVGEGVGVDFGAPFVRCASGMAAAYHGCLKAWIALDTWRYTSSAVLCHGPLPHPGSGELSAQLWAWRRIPKIPDWLATNVMDPKERVGHVQRRAQLCHEFAIMLLFGTSSEVRDSLAALVTYSDAEFGTHDIALLDEIPGVASAGTASVGSGLVLANALHRHGLTMNSILGTRQVEQVSTSFCGEDAKSVGGGSSAQALPQFCNTKRGAGLD